MIQTNEQALICDLAETYHIFDYRSLPVNLVATLSSGLGDNSRIMLQMRGEKVPRNFLLLAMIYDRLTMMTADPKNKPTLITDLIFDREEKSSRDFEVFDTAEDFNARIKAITNKEGGA